MSKRKKKWLHILCAVMALMIAVNYIPVVNVYATETDAVQQENQNPETPAENPGAGEESQNIPDTSEASSIPDDSNTPDDSKTPDDSNTPDTSDTPGASDALNTSETLEVPNTSDAPEPSDVPDTQQKPEGGQDNENPAKTPAQNGAEGEEQPDEAGKSVDDENGNKTDADEETEKKLEDEEPKEEDSEDDLLLKSEVQEEPPMAEDLLGTQVTVYCANSNGFYAAPPKDEDKGKDPFAVHEGGNKLQELRENTFELEKTEDGWQLTIETETYVNLYNSGAREHHLPLDKTVSVPLVKGENGWTIDGELKIASVCVPAIRGIVNLQVICDREGPNHTLEFGRIYDGTQLFLTYDGTVERNSGNDKFSADEYPFVCVLELKEADLKFIESIVYNSLATLPDSGFKYLDEYGVHKLSETQDGPLSVTFYWNRAQEKWELASDDTLKVHVECEYVKPNESGDLYVSASGDNKNAGTKEQPYATLDHAVEVAKNGATIHVLSDLTVNKFVNVWNKEVTIAGDGGIWTVSRGDIPARQDNARSTYNPAMIEVNGKLRLENIILDDAGKTAGSRYAQASTDGTGGNSDTVQDAIIATYDGDGDVVILGKGAELRGYGGMSAVRLSGGTLIMENGSKITGGKAFDTKGGGTGPAGAVWIQGGSFTMNEGAEISGVAGRAVYVDGGSAVINGVIHDVTPNANMWQGAEGVGAHVRNGGQFTLNGSIIGNGKGVALKVDGNGGFTMNKDAVIKDLEGAISVNASADIFVDGEITNIKGSKAISLQGGPSCTIGPNGNIHHNNVGRTTIYFQTGTLDVYGKIHHNFSSDKAGGIEVNNNTWGELTMYPGAEITDNYAKEHGGGVLVCRGIFTMEGGTIARNVAGLQGGGVNLRRGGSLIMKGGEIRDNASAMEGGGIAYDYSETSYPNMYADLQGGSISGNKMMANVIPNADQLSAVVEGGTANELAIYGGTGSVKDYVVINPGVSVNRNVYMKADKKTVTVTDGTKLGNASASDITALKNQGSTWGFADPAAAMWVQNTNGSTVTVSGLTLNREKPVWVLAKNGDTITRIPAAENSGVVSFRAPATENGCALAVVQPAEGDVLVTLTSTLTRIVENDIPETIPYEAAFNLREGATEDVLAGATDVEVTFLFQSGEEKTVEAVGNSVSLDAAFDRASFQAGENIVMGAVLTFQNNGQRYAFYSNNSFIPMIAVYTVTFDSNGGSEVTVQEVVNGDRAERPADPLRSGYTFEDWTLDGEGYDFTAPVTGNITLTAQWTRAYASYPLTIHYVYEDGTEAAPAYTANVQEESDYSVVSPEIAGYTADQLVINGTMPSQARDVTVTYRRNPVVTYLLSIQYLYADGTTAAPAHAEMLSEGAAYRVASPEITGYTADQAVVSGTMDAAGRSVTVTYTANTVPAPDPTPAPGPTPAPAPDPAPTPGYTGGGDAGTTAAPAATPTPGTAPAPAAAPGPAPAAPTAPVEPETVVEPVEEPEVPLADTTLPDEEVEPELEPVEEPEVPLASGEKWALLNFLLMLFTVAVSGIMVAGTLRKKEDEYGDCEEDYGRNGIFRLLSLAPAVGSAVAFLLTERMWNPMVFVDRMTLLMVLIAALQIAIMVVVYKGKALLKDTEE